MIDEFLKDTKNYEERKIEDDIAQKLIFEKALGGLSSEHKAILLLHLSGYKQVEIAEKTGLTKAQVWPRLRHAKKQFTELYRSALDDEF